MELRFPLFSQWGACNVAPGKDSQVVFLDFLHVHRTRGAVISWERSDLPVQT